VGVNYRGRVVGGLLDDEPTPIGGLNGSETADKEKQHNNCRGSLAIRQRKPVRLRNTFTKR
jgi:hypothetical protein